MIFEMFDQIDEETWPDHKIEAHTFFFYFQCVSVLCTLAFGLPPHYVIAALKFLLAFTFTLQQCSLISLSLFQDIPDLQGEN